MAESNLTLKKLFMDGPGDEESVERSSSMVEVRESFSEELPKVGWSEVSKGIDTKVDEVLAIPVDDVLAASWAQYERLRQYADPEQHPPEETVQVPMVDHTVESTHSPAVEVLIHDTEVASLTFNIQLQLRVKGCLLEISGGRIMKVRSGTCQVSGNLECVVNTRFKSHPLYKKSVDSREYAIVGNLDLGDGVALPPPKAAG